MGRISVDTEVLRNIIKQYKNFSVNEKDLIFKLRKGYQKTSERWNDLQYKEFQSALFENEKVVKKLLSQVDIQVNALERKLLEVNQYLSNPIENYGQINSNTSSISLEDRALFELEVLRSDLELTNGDPNVPQLGGLYGEIKGVIPGFEAHHIPSKAIQDVTASELPAIAISASDHALTDSYRGRQRHVLNSQLYSGTENYLEATTELIESGDYMQLVRFELLNIRDSCGHKYDGAISQYLDTLKNFILTNGLPKPKV